MTAVTSLEHLHKKGRFGNYQKKDEKNLLQISEVKNLTIIQLVQYKKSKIEPSAIKIEDLDLPLESLKVTTNKETRVLWNAPRTWLIISNKKNIESYLKLKDQELKDFNSKDKFSKKDSITEWEKLNTLDC